MLIKNRPESLFVSPEPDQVFLNLVTMSQKSVVSRRRRERRSSHHASRMIASICVGGGLGRVSSSLYGLPVLALPLMTHAHCKGGPLVCQRPPPGRTDETLQETPEAPRPKPKAVSNLPPPTANTAPLHKRQAAGGCWATESCTLLSSPEELLFFFSLETFSTTAALSADCFSLKQDQNPVTFLFINQGNAIHTSLWPPEGAVVINIACTRDSNQARNTDFSRFQEVRSPRTSICLLHATSLAKCATEAMKTEPSRRPFSTLPS